MKKGERTLCEVWCRTVGWMSSVSNMNKGKVAEVKDRKKYKVKKD